MANTATVQRHHHLAATKRTLITRRYVIVIKQQLLKLQNWIWLLKDCTHRDIAENMSQVKAVTLHWQTAKIEDCFKSFIFRNTLNRVGRRDGIV
jgi:hypothetical protein